MNAIQNIFNDVARHLLTQGRRALYTDEDDDLVCAYRADDGLKCAVGCLIPDSLYTRDLESKNVNTVVERGAIPGVTINDHAVITALYTLQSIHDDEPPNCWLEALAEFARFNDLDPNVLMEVDHA